MTWKQIKLMKEYLLKNGVDESEVLCMTVSEIIDKYYSLKGVNL